MQMNYSAKAIGKWLLGALLIQAALVGLMLGAVCLANLYQPPALEANIRDVAFGHPLQEERYSRHPRAAGERTDQQAPHDAGCVFLLGQGHPHTLKQTDQDADGRRQGTLHARPDLRAGAIPAGVRTRGGEEARGFGGGKDRPG